MDIIKILDLQKLKVWLSVNMGIRNIFKKIYVNQKPEITVVGAGYVDICDTQMHES